MKHLKHLKHTLATWESPGSDNSSCRGWSRRRATTAAIASSTGLGSVGRAARTMGRSKRRGMGEHDGWERAARDGRAAIARRSGHAVSGREGRDRSPEKATTLEKASSGRATGRCARGGWQSHACGSRKRKCRCVFLKKNHVILKVERRRTVGLKVERRRTVGLKVERRRTVGPDR
jgi:hypothetical protein